MSSRLSARPHYGWVVVGAFFVVLALSGGIRFGFGPFLKAMTVDLGLSRGGVSVVVAVSMLVFGAAMPVAGRFVDVWGARPVVGLGAVTLSAGLVGTGYAHGMADLLLWYGLVASIGMAGESQVVASAVVSRWFERRRGTALTLLSAAAMGGITLFTPFNTYLGLTLGWRGAHVALGLLNLALVLPLAVWVVRDAPGAAGAGGERLAVWTALRTRPFWLLAAGFFTCGFSMNLLSAHGVPMLTDHHFDPMLAASALGLVGLTSMFGAVAMGVVSDQVGRRPLLGAIYFVRGLGFIGLFFSQAPWQLFLVAGFAGLVWAGSSGLTSALTGDLYGRQSVGTLFGLIFFGHQVGAAMGSYLGGLTFDLTGSYGAIFVATGLLLVAGSIAVAAVPEGRPLRPALLRVAGGD